MSGPAYIFLGKNLLLSAELRCREKRQRLSQLIRKHIIEATYVKFGLNEILFGHCDTRKVFSIQPLPFIVIDCFSLAILFLIFLNIRHHGSQQYLLDQKIFMLLILCDAIILVLDMGMWYFDGKPGALIRILYSVDTAVYYVLNPLICLIWYVYVDYEIYQSENHLKKILLPISIPAVVNLLLAILSIFYGPLFSFAPFNVYHRGDLFNFMAVTSLFYLVCSMILIIIKRKMIQRQYYVTMLVFALPPLAGGIVQTAHYGVSLVWPCATLSALIVFINIQNNQLYTDYLTGLYNRRQLDNYLRQKSQNLEKTTLAGIMIDLNSFKSINDIYGHSIGDQALQHTAEILRNTFREDCFIARYGGDEFVILMTVESSRTLLEAIGRLKQNLDRFNEKKAVAYTLGFSIGSALWEGESEGTAAGFLKKIDNLMYMDKQKKMSRL